MQGSGLSLGVQSGMYQTLCMRWWNVISLAHLLLGKKHRSLDNHRAHKY